MFSLISINFYSNFIRLDIFKCGNLLLIFQNFKLNFEIKFSSWAQY